MNLNKVSLLRLWRSYKKSLLILRIAIVAALLPILYLLGLRLAFGHVFYSNVTASAPAGLYIATPTQKLTYGDYAIVESPVDIPAIHLTKGFLLLKRVVALPGDTYTVTLDRLATEGAVYPTTHLSYLPQLRPGQYTVPDQTILFLNPPADSLDSRYFGPVSTTHIHCRVVLLIPYDTITHLIKEVPFL